MDMKIGRVAQESGLSVRTIRYYADLRLLQSTMTRSPAGYRLFSHEVIARLDFIKRAQALGLTLQEIKDILSVYDRGTLPCNVIKELLVEHLTKINRQMESLGLLKAQLQEILSDWQEFSEQPSTGATICPNLQ